MGSRRERERNRKRKSCCDRRMMSWLFEILGTRERGGSSESPCRGGRLSFLDVYNGGFCLGSFCRVQCASVFLFGRVKIMI